MSATRRGADGVTFSRSWSGSWYGRGDALGRDHVLTWPAQGGGWWAGRQRWTFTPGEADPIEEKAPRGAWFPTLAAVVAGWPDLPAVAA